MRKAGKESSTGNARDSLDSPEPDGILWITPPPAAQPPRGYVPEAAQTTRKRMPNRFEVDSDPGPARATRQALADRRPGPPAAWLRRCRGLPLLPGADLRHPDHQD